MKNEEKQEFPVWNPNKKTISRITTWPGYYRYKEYRDSAFKAFRNSCCGFSQKPEVRRIILEKCNHRCVICGTSDNLQIDHIVSVYRHFKQGTFYSCNVESNLQILCGSCNASKQP